MRKQSLQAGDTVAYSRAFMKSIGCYTGSLPFARGTITAITDSGIASVAWNNDAPPRVNVANLCKPGSVAFVD